MVGFFSSSVLASLAPGLATYINSTDKSLRLIVSPYLSDADRNAIAEGLEKPEDIAAGVIKNLLITEDKLQQHTLKCFSYLMRVGRLELKIALLEDGLFHPKVWLFRQGDTAAAAHGSSNMTTAGVHRNVEQITVSRSWLDPTQDYIINKLQEEFDSLWANKEDYCIVINAPKAIEEKIIQSFSGEHSPTEDDYRALYRKAQAATQKPVEPQPGEVAPVTPNEFGIPEWLEYRSGPFAHQGQAVDAWCEADYRGVLEMATGSGKTITAMICAYRLYEAHKPLLIVVAAPYVPLIQQWCDEIEPFGLRPVNLTVAGGARGRSRELNRIKRGFRNGTSDIEVVIVSHDTLCNAALQLELEKFDCTTLLIADEVHNLGRESFVTEPPDFFDYRLGLSATPVRQYDEEGADELFSFFGPVVFRFTLKEAIGRCLVEYDYFVHPAELTPNEMDEWYDLTAKIKANAWRQKDKKPDDYLAKLFRDRRVLLETAERKMEALATALEHENLATLRYTLIYASDKAPQQLDDVNALLKAKGVLFHQLTHEETANRVETARIIKSFQDGELRILTAKRVLDEGVNIPQICKAFILASTTVERQWVQRRGRLLRICAEIGKTHSEIHDFIAIPPDLEKVDDEACALIRSELLRVQEFASLARNAGRSDGPLDVIDKLVKAAFT